MKIQAQPFDFVSWLGDKESLRVGRNFSSARIDGNLWIESVLGLEFDGQQKQLELGEAQSANSCN
jgi:hypothetical protein